VRNAIDAYRLETDNLGMFIAEVLVFADNNRLKTSELYQRYQAWVKANGFKAMNSHNGV